MSTVPRDLHFCKQQFPFWAFGVHRKLITVWFICLYRNKSVPAVGTKCEHLELLGPVKSKATVLWPCHCHPVFIHPWYLVSLTEKFASTFFQLGTSFFFYSTLNKFRLFLNRKVFKIIRASLDYSRLEMYSISWYSTVVFGKNITAKCRHSAIAINPVLTLCLP